MTTIAKNAIPAHSVLFMAFPFPRILLINLGAPFMGAGYGVTPHVAKRYGMGYPLFLGFNVW